MLHGSTVRIINDQATTFTFGICCAQSERSSTATITELSRRLNVTETVLTIASKHETLMSLPVILDKDLLMIQVTG